MSNSVFGIRLLHGYGPEFFRDRRTIYHSLVHMRIARQHNHSKGFRLPCLSRQYRRPRGSVLGDAARSNQEGVIYQSITVEDLYRVANKLFVPQNCSIVYYERSADGTGYYEEDEEED